MSIKEIIKPYIPAALRPFPKLILREIQILRAVFTEKFKKPSFGQPLPPPLLRHRVHGVADAKSFIEVGKACTQDIILQLDKIGRPLETFSNVLDFGCGCGRTFLHLEGYRDKCHFFGCDINPPLIKWCNENILWVEAMVNGFLPPTTYKKEQFDLIYAISVFTHLSEDHQFKWLEELKRISSKDAIILISIHGPSIRDRLKRTKSLSILEEKGFYFEVEGTGLFKQDGLPDFYQTAFHTENYICREWSKYFKVLNYIEKGINNDQDLVILQNS